MKNIIFVLGFVLFFCTAKAQTAADDVQQMIARALKLQAETPEGQPCYYAAMELANLSGHYPDTGIPNCYGPYLFRLTGEDITAWSQWFEQNKTTLKYGTLAQGTYQRKIIVSAQADGTFTATLDMQSIEMLQNHGYTFTY